jgi:hypothetical protein
MKVFMCGSTRHSMRGLVVMSGDVVCINKCMGSDRWFKAVPHQYSDGRRCLDCSFYQIKVCGFSLCIHLGASCQLADVPLVFKECSHESIVEDLM